MENNTDTSRRAITEGSAPDLTPPIFDRLGEGFGFDWGGVLGFLGDLWSIYAIAAYLLAGLFIYGFVYAAIRRGQLSEVLKEGIELQEKLWRKHHGSEAKNERWQDVLTHVESQNPNDWRLSIIEADIMLDDTLKQLGYAGTTLGERLRSITPSQLSSIDDAWQAHKVRNEIAHAGADFVLTQKLARETIGQYRRTLEELGVV